MSDDLEPIPDEGESTSADVLRTFIEIDGDLILRSMVKTAGGIVIDRPIGKANAFISALDSNGKMLDSVNIPTQLGSVLANGDSSPLNAIMGHIPFPEKTYEIEIETESTEKVLNPIERTVRDGIQRLPDKGFTNRPDERRNALFNALDAIDEQMEQKAFRGAKQTMQRDIRDKIGKWLKDDYDTAANQPTKGEMLDLVDDMIARLETLAKTSRSGQSSNKG